MKNLLLLALFAIAFTQTPPVLPPQFTIDFNETAKLLTTGTTKGTIYYDASNNREAVIRDNGQHDRYCGTVYKGTDTPCRHIVLDSKQKIM